jgi:hypothetical protein
LQHSAKSRKLPVIAAVLNAVFALSAVIVVPPWPFAPLVSPIVATSIAFLWIVGLFAAFVIWPRIQTGRASVFDDWVLKSVVVVFLFVLIILVLKLANSTQGRSLLNVLLTIVIAAFFLAFRVFFRAQTASPKEHYATH